MTTTRDDKLAGGSEEGQTRTLAFRLGRLDLSDMRVKPHDVRIVGSLPPAPDAVEAAEQVGTKAEGRSAPISQPTTTGGEAERDYPAEFEAWWACYRHRNREPAAYPVKKQIAFDAFYFAALATPPDPLTGEVREAKGTHLVEARLYCAIEAVSRLPTTTEAEAALMDELVAASAEARQYLNHLDAILSTRGSAPLDGEET